MVWRFLKHYGMNKASAMLEEFTSAVVAFDPHAASKAQIAMMETELNKLGGRVAEAEAELKREHQETLALKRSYEQYLQAARFLETKLTDGMESSRTSETEASLARILDKLEQMKPEIEREEREDAEVEAWRSELRRAFEELAQKIRYSHTQLDSARRQMNMAKLQKDRAQEQERRAREGAGLTKSIGSLSVALDAMNRETAKVRAQTEALKLKAGTLQFDLLESDPNVAAALSAVRANSVLERGSLSERLAMLGTRDGRQALIAAA